MYCRHAEMWIFLPYKLAMTQLQAYTSVCTFLETCLLSLRKAASSVQLASYILCTCVRRNYGKRNERVQSKTADRLCHKFYLLLNIVSLVQMGDRGVAS